MFYFNYTILPFIAEITPFLLQNSLDEISKHTCATWANHLRCAHSLWHAGCQLTNFGMRASIANSFNRTLQFLIGTLQTENTP